MNSIFTYANPARPDSERTISYNITKWDVLTSWMTIFFRSRLLLLLTLGLYTSCALSPLLSDFGRQSAFATAFEVASLFTGLVLFSALVHLVIALGHVLFQKDLGILGQHVLEIRDEGLVERTEFNESLHRWPSIYRILSHPGYLYIYVNATSAHMVPKRSFSPEELNSFETSLRMHARHLRS